MARTMVCDLPTSVTLNNRNVTCCMDVCRSPPLTLRKYWMVLEKPDLIECLVTTTIDECPHVGQCPRIIYNVIVSNIEVHSTINILL